MFAGIARRYDFLNHFLSVNTDKRWRRLVRKKLEDILNRQDALVLDVACGTGDLSVELQKNARAKIVGTIFAAQCFNRVRQKRKKSNRNSYVEADGMNLSFADASFDAVTIAFGLRNFSNWQDGLKELHRVTKKGGKLCHFRIFDAGHTRL
jgi:demethylmenaquinone methyltransferase/2-methoxy-6-polyprenyl-1,4-benzoquinol methylase